MNQQRRKFIACGSVALVAASCGISQAAESVPENSNEVFKNIFTRRSVRAYAHEPVSDEKIDEILAAAMMAPSAANEQPWEFVVMRKPELLAKIGEINQYASYAHKSPVSILLCLNEEKEKIKGMGILDMGMCAQNIMLAAHALGIGSVFTGIYPMQDRIKKFQELAKLPANVIPIGLIVLGYPEIKGDRTVLDRINKNAIHKDTWQGK